MEASDISSILALVRIADKDGAATWEQFKTPEELFAYLVKYFGVNPDQVSKIQRLAIGTDEPDKNAIWFNNSPDLPFIGIPIEGAFVKFYQYPPNSPFILRDPADLGMGVIQLDEELRESYGLPQLNSPAFWAILPVT